MDSPRTPPASTSSSRKQRHRQRASTGDGGGTRASNFLVRHPAAAAGLYMCCGGLLVYIFLGHSVRAQRQALNDGVVRLAATAPSPSAAALYYEQRAPATVASSEAPAPAQGICANTCFKANDGVCDDGRFLHNMTRGLPSTVLCDLGTDCTDCGPWQGVQHSSAWREEVGPVEFLRLANLTMLTKRSALAPKFHMAFTDPAHDAGNSHQFASLGALELRLSHIAYHVLHGPCQAGLSAAAAGGQLSGNGSTDGLDAAAEGLVLDVGAHFGYFSLLAGMLGCRVIAWEPVKTFQAYFEYGIARNRLEHKVEVRAAALTAPVEEPGRPVLQGSTPAALAVKEDAAAPHTRKQLQQQQRQRRRRLQGRQQPRQQLQQQQQQQQQPVMVGRNVTLVVPRRGGAWSTASVAGSNIFLNVNHKELELHRVVAPAETLDHVVLPRLRLPPTSPPGGADAAGSSSGSASSSSSSDKDGTAVAPWQRRRHTRVALAKLDVEGHEPDVLLGASGLLASKVLDNILLEYSPMVAERNNITKLSDYPNMLLSLLQHNFRLGHLSDKAYGSRMLGSYSEPLLRLQAVTATNLKFDLWDSMQMTEVGHTWLHEPCPEMAAYQLLGQGVPERLHPKSLRATFEVATSIWASRQPRFVPHLQGPPVGIFPPSRPLSESWFIPEFSDVGMGGRTCTNLREVAAAEGLSHAARASFLIANRCRCMPGGPAAAPSTRGGGGCPAEEAVAEACARAGQTPFRDTPDLVAE